jgi:hypothetical protein
MTSPGFTPVPTTTRPWRRASLSSILATTGERWVGQDSSSQVETTCSPHPRLDWICSVTDETEEPVHNTATEAPTPACFIASSMEAHTRPSRAGSPSTVPRGWPANMGSAAADSSRSSDSRIPRPTAQPIGPRPTRSIRVDWNIAHLSSWPSLARDRIGIRASSQVFPGARTGWTKCAHPAPPAARAHPLACVGW